MTETPAAGLLPTHLGWLSGQLRSSRPGPVFSAAALITSLCFVTGMALWGTHAQAGYFYAASMFIGAPVLWAMRPWETLPPWPIRIYAALYGGLLFMCILHFLFRDAPSGWIDYSGRFLFGLINGLFFFLLFGRDRQALFRFIVLVAGAHWAVAVGYTIFVGFDFENLSRIGPRVGGNTNPIPYSFLYISSAGIVVLALADRMRPDRKYLPLAAIVAVLGATALAATISGSRGPLIAMPLLLVLVGALLWFRVGTTWSLGIFAVATGLFLTAAAAVFARDPHLWATSWEYLAGDPDLVQGDSAASMRYDLWRAAIRLIPEQPLFGHGLSSMPEVLHHPASGVPEGSVLLNFGHVHNEYLDTLLKMGIAGFVPFYAPMLLALWMAWRRLADPAGRIWALAVAWVVGAQLIYGLTSVMFAHGVTVLQFGAYLGMLMFVVTPDDSEVAHDQP